MRLDRIGVFGGGAWATALAALSAQPDRTIVQWMRDAETASAINRLRENPRRLPGIPLPMGIEAVTDAARLAGAEAFIAAVPTSAMRDVLTLFVPHIPAEARLIIAAKGYEHGTNAPMSAVARDTLGLMPFILSGPTFAEDVARALPAAAVLAGQTGSAAADLGNALSTTSFRIYFSADIKGVQFGGAAKNVLAIACGMAAGMRLGDSARAALITRAAAELTRLGQAIGVSAETLNGLSCLGDLILTAMSAQSRNFSLGFALGEGRPLADALASSRGVCEGVPTAPVIVSLAREHRIEAPIATAVEAILAGRSSPAEQMADLLGRPLRPE
jgi:glycerol-3-phosphate dehydrogenase (NAD(P)+)